MIYYKQIIRDVCWDEYCKLSDRRLSVTHVMYALANGNLAEQSDKDEILEAAENPDLALVLFENGACFEGMQTVGIKARDWAHLWQLCEDADRYDWMDWVEDSFYHDELEDWGWF